MSLADTISRSIRTRMLDRLLDPNVPVKDQDAPRIADKLTEVAAPIIVNAVNAEPWYKSRIYRGAAMIALGFAAHRFGWTVDDRDVELILTYGGQVVESLGLLYTIYGRWVGATKAPPKL